jgi:hypothetical protein
MAQTALISLVTLHKAPADPSDRERHNPLIGRTKNDQRLRRFYLAVPLLNILDDEKRVGGDG